MDTVLENIFADVVCSVHSIIEAAQAARLLLFGLCGSQRLGAPIEKKNQIVNPLTTIVKNHIKPIP